MIDKLFSGVLAVVLTGTRLFVCSACLSGETVRSNDVCASCAWCLCVHSWHAGDAASTGDLQLRPYHTSNEKLFQDGICNIHRLHATCLVWFGYVCRSIIDHLNLSSTDDVPEYNFRETAVYFLVTESNSVQSRVLRY